MSSMIFILTNTVKSKNQIPTYLEVTGKNSKININITVNEGTLRYFGKKKKINLNKIIIMKSVIITVMITLYQITEFAAQLSI